MLAVLRTTAVAVTISGAALAADYSCEGLVPVGERMICSGFEPNWAIELICNGSTLSANFIDAFSGSGCTDESDAVRDFTFTPTAAPGLSPPFHSFCCRIP